MAAMPYDGIDALAAGTSRRNVTLTAVLGQARLWVELVLHRLGLAGDFLDEGPGLSMSSTVHGGKALLSEADETVGIVGLRSPPCLPPPVRRRCP